MPMSPRRPAPAGWEPPYPRLRLVVHAGTARLPALFEVVAPGGAPVRGFPLRFDGDDPAADLAGLESPIELGHRFVVRGDSGTLVDVSAIPGRGPPPPLAGPDVPADVAAAIESSPCRLAVGLLAPGEDAAAAVVFSTRLADRLAAAVDGVVVDVDGSRVFGPAGWRVDDAMRPVDVREHVVVHSVGDDRDGFWVHSHGLVKFGRAELELRDVPAALADAATAFVLNVGQYAIAEAPVEPWHTLAERDAPLMAVPGGDDADHWGDTPVLELVDVRGGRPDRGVSRGLAAWAAAPAD
jgi:hypothetical protein